MNGFNRNRRADRALRIVDYNRDHYIAQNSLKRYPIHINNEPTWLTLSVYAALGLASLLLIIWVRG